MSSDMTARLAAIKDIPTARLIELAAAESEGRIVILASTAEIAHRAVQPNEPLSKDKYINASVAAAEITAAYTDGRILTAGDVLTVLELLPAIQLDLVASGTNNNKGCDPHET